MTTDSSTEPTPVDAARNRIVESFTSLCGDPDNATVAKDADDALHSLEGLLRQPPLAV